MERDVFNEKPTKEETMAAEQVRLFGSVLIFKILRFFDL